MLCKLIGMFTVSNLMQSLDKWRRAWNIFIYILILLNMLLVWRKFFTFLWIATILDIPYSNQLTHEAEGLARYQLYFPLPWRLSCMVDCLPICAGSSKYPSSVVSCMRKYPTSKNAGKYVNSVTDINGRKLVQARKVNQRTSPKKKNPNDFGVQLHVCLRGIIRRMGGQLCLQHSHR